MRKRLAFVALVGLLALLPALVAADSAVTKVEFEGTALVAVVGPLQALDPGTATPMDTDARFRVRRGTVKSVRVKTVNEYVAGVGPIALTECEPVDHPFCSDLPGATISSLHSSSARLKDVTQMPAPVAVGMLLQAGYGNPGLVGLFALAGVDVLAGDLKGRLRGSATLAKSPTDVMVDDIRMKIRRNPAAPNGVPTAIYGCVASLDPARPDFLAPTAIATCVDDQGELIPIFLSIRDSGKLSVNANRGDVVTGVFEDVEKLKTEVEVVVDGPLGAPTTVGVVTFTNGKAKVRDEAAGPGRHGDDDDDGDDGDDRGKARSDDRDDRGDGRGDDDDEDEDDDRGGRGGDDDRGRGKGKGHDD